MDVGPISCRSTLLGWGLDTQGGEWDGGLTNGNACTRRRQKSRCWEHTDGRRWNCERSGTELNCSWDGRTDGGRTKLFLSVGPLAARGLEASFVPFFSCCCASVFVFPPWPVISADNRVPRRSSAHCCSPRLFATAACLTGCCVRSPARLGKGREGKLKLCVFGGPTIFSQAEPSSLLRGSPLVWDANRRLVLCPFHFSRLKPDWSLSRALGWWCPNWT